MALFTLHQRITNGIIYPPPKLNALFVSHITHVT